MTKEIDYDRSQVWKSEIIPDFMGHVVDDGGPVGFWVRMGGTTVDIAGRMDGVKALAVLTADRAVLKASAFIVEFQLAGSGTIRFDDVFVVREQGWCRNRVADEALDMRKLLGLAKSLKSRSFDAFMLGDKAADAILETRMAASLGKLRKEAEIGVLYSKLRILAKSVGKRKVREIANDIVDNPELSRKELVLVMAERTVPGITKLAGEFGMAVPALLKAFSGPGQQVFVDDARKAFTAIPQGAFRSLSDTRKSRLLVNCVLSGYRGMVEAATVLAAHHGRGMSVEEALSRLMKLTGRSQAEFSMLSKWLRVLRQTDSAVKFLGGWEKIARGMFSPSTVKTRLDRFYVRRKTLDKKRLALARALILTGVEVHSDTLARMQFAPDSSNGIMPCFSMIMAEPGLPGYSPHGRRVPLSAVDVFPLEKMTETRLDRETVMALPSCLMGEAAHLDRLVLPAIEKAFRLIGREKTLENLRSFDRKAAMSAVRLMAVAKGVSIHLGTSGVVSSSSMKGVRDRTLSVMAAFGKRFVQFVGVAPMLGHLIVDDVFNSDREAVLRLVLDGVPLATICKACDIDERIARFRIVGQWQLHQWPGSCPPPKTLPSQVFLYKAFKGLGERFHWSSSDSMAIAGWVADHLDQFGEGTGKPGLSELFDIFDWIKGCIEAMDAEMAGIVLGPDKKGCFVRKRFTTGLSVSGALKRARLWEREVADNLIPEGYDDPLPESIIDTTPEKGDRVVMTHLTTPRELAEEGKAMRHCVGGYVGQARREESWLYAVEATDGTRSTLEVGVRDGVPHVAQLRAKGNGEVPDDIRQSVEAQVARGHAKRLKSLEKADRIERFAA